MNRPRAVCAPGPRLSLDDALALGHARAECFSGRARRALAGRGMTAAAVAQAIDVDEATVTSWLCALSAVPSTAQAVAFGRLLRSLK